ASAAGKVVLRTIGGAYEEAVVKAIVEPFTKATGIEVVKVPATLGKLLAMFESGNIELDVVDAGELGMISLSQKGALEKINYKGWKLSNPDDIDPIVRREDMVSDLYFSSVLGYNTQSFPTGKQPRSWAEFWDLKKFPGPRMLADLASGNIDLEFALLADGVPKDKLYPLDIERGFKSLDRVRPAIRKFWDTGALSAQMLADKEVVLGSIWNGRLQAVADKGAPLAIEWNEASLQSQYWGVVKGADQALRAGRGGQRRLHDRSCRIVLHTPGTERLGQDDHAHDGGGVRPSEPRRDRNRRHRRGRAPPAEARPRHGLPELRRVPAPHRLREHRVSARGSEGVRRRDPPPGRRGARAGAAHGLRAAP